MADVVATHAGNVVRAIAEGGAHDSIHFGRQSKCGSKTKGSYDTPLHVLALIIVLALSTLACGFPILVRRVPQLKVPHHFLFLARHFGTGVLLATAFVHLLPTAFISLTDPCLPKFWTETYPAMAGAIALAAVFFVVTIEMIFSGFGAPTHSHGDFEQIVAPSSPALRPDLHPDEDPEYQTNGEAASSLLGKSSHKRTRSGSISTQLNRISSEQDGDGIALETILSDSEDEGSSSGGAAKRRNPKQHDNHLPSIDQMSPAEIAQQKKNLLQVVLLEAGILFHSVFIGMALSVATGSNFIVLLIAISFHQTFEGLALGARISAITIFPEGSLKPWLMALAYGTTTPIGQAIGLATHTLYDPASEVGLLMVGIMNAISSGLLLFAGLVELLAEDFLTDESWKILKGKKRIHASLCVFAGAFGMAFIGAFA
ncbi:hypothetical protein TWF569_010296 [Orbilia oligospora]|uniref:High-affinity Zn(2+) transporter zrt1 n=1 Tax=Orbilia oligospora TaxID=2813651 RepID=A0A7C8NFX0_ORBOL|nr:hypothetical protein TWF103_011122 [Orbilia oligospora]KAF3104491.1 hypothetical protein TWF102_003121 [Orbilia oligospora]KAF3113987.1 hypothetical protein TWF706_009337 [Orbilia oligospora]KAF3120734.1 hypothetical protein TWF594_003679 [Orbilia oligospora]KAF3134098.1 hypothetical protein TWF569_010296 [Orbilia oligospora]